VAETYLLATRCPVCIGGMTLIQALERNLRTCPTMPREKVQAVNLRGRKYRCGGQGGLLRNSKEAG